MWTRLCSWTAAMLCRTRKEREMDEEIRFHVEARAADLVFKPDTVKDYVEFYNKKHGGRREWSLAGSRRRRRNAATQSV